MPAERVTLTPTDTLTDDDMELLKLARYALRRRDPAALRQVAAILRARADYDEKAAECLAAFPAARNEDEPMTAAPVVEADKGA